MSTGFLCPSERLMFQHLLPALVCILKRAVFGFGLDAEVFVNAPTGFWNVNPFTIRTLPLYLLSVHLRLHHGDALFCFFYCHSCVINPPVLYYVDLRNYLLHPRNNDLHKVSRVYPICRDGALSCGFATNSNCPLHSSNLSICLRMIHNTYG